MKKQKLTDNQEINHKEDKIIKTFFYRILAN